MGPFCLSNLKKGKARSPNLEMNLPSTVMQPLRRCISLTFRGMLSPSIALIFSGLASIPQCDTKKPRSLPEGTPKTHFSGLSLIWIRRKLLKVSRRSARRVPCSLDFTTMSST